MLTLKSGFPSPWPSKLRISRNVLGRDSCRERSSHSKGYFDLNSLLWTSHQSEMQRHVQLLPINIISPMFQKFEIVELPGRAPQNCWEPNFHTHNCQWVALLFVKVSCDLEQTSNVTILGFYVILYPICSSLFHKNCRTTHQKNQIILSRWLHKGSLTSLPLGENTTSRRVSTNLLKFNISNLC